jgi:beta-carotene hydroxylase
VENAAELHKNALKLARNHAGNIGWPTIVLALVVFPAYWALPYLVMFYGMSLFIAIPVMVGLTYGSYTVLHEAVHSNIHGDNESIKWINGVLGYLSATIIVIPQSPHRISHLIHHGNTNDKANDPDVHIEHLFKSPKRMLHSVVEVVACQFRVYKEMRWANASLRENAVVVSEFCTAVALRILPFALLFAVGDAESVARWWQGVVLFVVAGIIGTFVLLYLFAYAVHQPHKSTERYHTTRTIVVLGPFSSILDALWGYQNYHAVHHLFPSVPFYNYRRLFRDVAPALDAMNAPVYKLGWKGLQRIRAADAC